MNEFAYLFIKTSTSYPESAQKPYVYLNLQQSLQFMLSITTTHVLDLNTEKLQQDKWVVTFIPIRFVGFIDMVNCTTRHTDHAY